VIGLYGSPPPASKSAFAKSEGCSGTSGLEPQVTSNSLRRQVARAAEDPGGTAPSFHGPRLRGPTDQSAQPLSFLSRTKPIRRRPFAWTPQKKATRPSPTINSRRLRRFRRSAPFVRGSRWRVLRSCRIGPREALRVPTGQVVVRPRSCGPPRGEPGVRGTTACPSVRRTRPASSPLTAHPATTPPGPMPTTRTDTPVPWRLPVPTRGNCRDVARVSVRVVARWSACRYGSSGDAASIPDPLSAGRPASRREPGEGSIEQRSRPPFSSVQRGHQEVIRRCRPHVASLRGR
jgi:hypothetical protein